jgi:tripartite-type tricarboxylate transporter receptor subunit TctC
MKPVRRIFLHLAALAALTVPAAAQAQSLAGKSVQIIIGAGTGGGTDIWGRVVARHIGKHLPGNPTVVPQNMPGAGSLNAANHIYNVAPKDGTVMGTISGAAALGPITGAPGARFDPTRITWLGASTTATSICIAYNSPQVKVKTLKDLSRRIGRGRDRPRQHKYTSPRR